MEPLPSLPEPTPLPCRLDPRPSGDALTITSDRPVVPAGSESAVPGTRIGRYEIRRELGRGGMGVVYLAQDCDLKREVALKLLVVEGGATLDQVKRFHREAEAAARLQHPHIVATYDVGIADAKHFFTMEVVVGGSVAQKINLQKALPPRDGMRIVAEAAEGVHHAHLHGILHRDLKPENLLIDADGTVKVSDFGLARVMSEPGLERLTRTGVVMGTPAHMAPEQAEGESASLDARADVYSLGSVLYELVTGQPPYPGNGPMEVLIRKVAKDPPAPRKLNPELSQDVETIIRKAMEREPAARYPSAAALAEDVRRWLAGQVILARPVSGMYRVWKWTQRNRLASTAMAAAGVALLTASATTWRASVQREESRREAAAAERQMTEERRRTEAARAAVIEQLRTVSAVALDAVLGLRRAGVREGTAGFAAHLERAFAQATATAPDLAEPHYHLGRLRRALLRWEDALALQEGALRRDPAYAPARYERALLTARRYALRLGELQDAWRRRESARAMAGAEPRPPATNSALAADDAAARALAEGIAEDLTALAQAPADFPRARMACARALLVLYSAGEMDDLRAARAGFEDALAGEPTLEEAYEGLAQLDLALGDPAKAIAVYTRGLAMDRGYVPHWLGRGSARLTVAFGLGERGGDARAEYGQAVADFTQAIELAPELSEAWANRGAVWSNLANALEQRGDDPADPFAHAESDLAKAVELDPANAVAWVRRGMVRGNAARRVQGTGGDPEALYRGAVDDYDRALVLAPEWSEARFGRGAVRLNWGNGKIARGVDPAPCFVPAEEDFAKALAADSANVEAWMSRGVLRMNWAIWKRGRGENPEECYRKAEEAIDRATALAPRSAGAWQRRGQLGANRALWEESCGRDPEAVYTRAFEDYGRALEINPALLDAWTGRGDLGSNWGVRRRARGGDPEALYRRAEADYDAALEINPQHAEAFLRRGLVRTNRGVHEEATGRDPLPTYAAAEADFGKAIERNANWAEAWKRRGSLRLNRGANLSARGGDAEAEYAGAVSDLDRALALNRSWADAWSTRGDVNFNWGSHLFARNQDPGERYAAAVTDYEMALQLNPRVFLALTRRATLYGSWALWRQARGEDPADLYDRGEQGFAAALEIYPRATDLWLGRGDLRLNRGAHEMKQGGDAPSRFAEAEADYAKAVELNGGSFDPWLRRGTARLNAGYALQGTRKEAAGVRFAAALEDLEQAVALDGGRAESVARRGWARLALERWVEAIADFETAAKLDPALAASLAPALAEARKQSGLPK